MAVKRIDIETFLSFNFTLPIIDVRSEGEFAHAHIPGAISLPLFDNEERKIIGTTYKQESKQKAIKIGLAAFGKKMVQMIETIDEMFDKNGKEKTLVIHCWRGGMRSAGVAWLFDLYGYTVYTLVGGYKAFRKWGIQQFSISYPLQILGGYTGSGKTYVLQELDKRNEIVIDLEGLANHKGSAFGKIGMPEQPSQEMFENLLAVQLWKAHKKCHEKIEQLNTHSLPQYKPIIWVEDESQRIGTVNIPSPFFLQMRNTYVCYLNIPFDKRLQHILEGYGKADKEILVNAIIRIQKRLGGLETKKAIECILENNIEEAFAILLTYYDKQYQKGVLKRDNLEQFLIKIDCDGVEAAKNAYAIMKQLKETT